MARQRSIIIIPAAIQAEANAAAKTVDMVGGEHTFRVGMLNQASADTKPTFDYYICNWQFEGDKRAAFQTACEKAGIWDQMKVHDLDAPDSKVARPTKTEVLTIERIKEKPSTRDVAAPKPTTRFASLFRWLV
jgi:hypothetical protein